MALDRPHAANAAATATAAHAVTAQPRRHHGLLPPHNPVLGTFQHAPSAANARSKYFAAHVVSQAEFERLKALRHNPYTGQFHSGPRSFAPMHGLQRLYRLRDKGNSDSLVSASSGSSASASVLSSPSALAAADAAAGADAEIADAEAAQVELDGGMFFLDKLPDPAAAVSDDDGDDDSDGAADEEDDAFADDSDGGSSLGTTAEVTTFGLGSGSVWGSMPARLDDAGAAGSGSAVTPPASVAGDAPSPGAAAGLLHVGFATLRGSSPRAAGMLARSRSLEEGGAETATGGALGGSYSSTGSLADLAGSDAHLPRAPAMPAPPAGARRRVRRRSLSVDRIDFDGELAGGRASALMRRRRSQSAETAEWPVNLMHLAASAPASASAAAAAAAMAAAASAAAAAAAPGGAEPAWNPWIVNRTRELTASYRVDLTPAGALGKGAYSVVKVCTSRGSGQRLAVKIVRKRLLVSRGEKDMIRREVELHQVLRHAHIVRLLEIFEDDKRLFLVQERANAGTLQQLLLREGGSLPEPECRRLAAQLLDAVAYLHRSGVLQGDLKPANVLLHCARDGARPAVKLCDFGLSRKVPDIKNYEHTGDVHKVPFTQLVGTMGYVAPELLRKEAYTVAVDLWAVGIMLYEMLSGVRPFLPYKDCLTQPLQFPPSVWAKVSTAAADLVAQLLRKDPAARLTAADALQHRWTLMRLAM